MPGHPTDRPTPSGGMSLSVLLAEVTGRLVAAGVASPGPDARALLDHVLGAGVGRRHRLGGNRPDGSGAAQHRPETKHAVDAVDAVDAGTLAELWRAVGRREHREPLEYITGVAYFRGIELAVGSGVFIPRRESEVTAALAIAALDGSTAHRRTGVAVDLGTGCGAIALAIATKVPGSVVYGVEVSPAALEWAALNVATVAPENSRAVLADLSDCLPELDGTVDVVVSNPPYIPVGGVPRDLEVRLHSPEVALYGGEDGLDLVRLVIRTAGRLLGVGGVVVIEHGELQGDEIAAQLRGGGWTHVAHHRDHLGRDRAITARPFSRGG